MTITLSKEIEEALIARAKALGKTPDALLDETLRIQFAPAAALAVVPGVDAPRDEWEKRFLAIGQPASMSLTNEQLGRESIYED